MAKKMNKSEEFWDRASKNYDKTEERFEYIHSKSRECVILLDGIFQAILMITKMAVTSIIMKNTSSKSADGRALNNTRDVITPAMVFPHLLAL